MNQDNLKFIHNTIIYWIDKTDSKANIFLGIQLAILGYFLFSLSSFDLDFYCESIVLFGFLISTFFVLFFIFKIIWPKLSTKEPISFIYFKHIYEKYAKKRERAMEDFGKINNQDVDNDLINQIVSLSIVATSKYKDLQKAIIFLVIEIIFIILLYI
ncbi:hypothetical protein AMJ47_01265 [Parcubacteria bacterium DG_72]|nr:MAG: hypothetical protein AMJ47_01265 [Parcubacteria bacterium DG_72]